MGWIPDDDALVGTHEGWAAYLAPDGRLSGTSGIAGFFVGRSDAYADAATRLEGQVTPGGELDELIPWPDLVGWQSACACGWSGVSWRRGQTTPGRYGGFESDDAYLSDGRTIDDAAHEAWQQEHITPLETAGMVRVAAARVAAARRDLDLAVAEARMQSPQASWAVIGRAAGMSRQAARERWSAEP